MKVLILFLEYPPIELFCAVPVFPPTSYPFTFAKDAVPSFVVTIFLKTGKIFLETLWFKIFSFFDKFPFLIKVGFIL